MRAYDLGNLSNVEDYILLIKDIIDKNKSEVVLISSALFKQINLTEINGVPTMDGGFKKFDYVELI